MLDVAVVATGPVAASGAVDGASVVPDNVAGTSVVVAAHRAVAFLLGCCAGWTNALLLSSHIERIQPSSFLVPEVGSLRPQPPSNPHQLYLLALIVRC